jgi:hypothetical protein
MLMGGSVGRRAATPPPRQQVLAGKSGLDVVGF